MNNVRPNDGGDGSSQAAASLGIVILFCLVFMGPFALFVTVDLMKVELPTYMTAEESTYLAGGITDVNMRATANISACLDGMFQEAFEEEIGNYIPFKAMALFGNSLRQRIGIEASNCFFDWTCYPTFYGSRYVYIPSQDALTWMASKDEQFDHAGFDHFFEKAMKAAHDNPSMDFIVYMTDPNNDLSPLNPSYEYVSGSMDYADLVERLGSIDDAAPSNLSIMHGGG